MPSEKKEEGRRATVCAACRFAKRRIRCRRGALTHIYHRALVPVLARWTGASQISADTPTGDALGRNLLVWRVWI